MPARKVYLDIAKGIAIILVVYAHAAAQTEGTRFLLFLKPIFSSLEGGLETGFPLS